MKLFAPGDSVVWRSVNREERIVQTVWPWTVVSDTPKYLAMLYRLSPERMW